MILPFSYVSIYEQMPEIRAYFNFLFELSNRNQIQTCSDKP